MNKTAKSVHFGSFSLPAAPLGLRSDRRAIRNLHWFGTDFHHQTRCVVY